MPAAFSIRWDISSKMPIDTIFHGELGINDYAFSPDSRFIAVASYDSFVLLWDTKNNKADTIPLQGSAKFVEFSNKGQHLITISTIDNKEQGNGEAATGGIIRQACCIIDGAGRACKESTESWVNSQC